jgi:lysyl-tRNA synthetase class 1
MLDINLIQSTSSWPFVEIRKLLKDRKDLIKSKNKITFQTGYGPSGLPHIGTFGEVARTTMMINALNHIQTIESDLIQCAFCIMLFFSFIYFIKEVYKSK